MKKYLLCPLLLVCFGACSQKKEPKKLSNLTSKNFMEIMLKAIKHYDYEPMYYLTYVQNVCYSEILVNDIPVNRNYKEVTYGETIHINEHIFKSGT